VAPGVTEFTDPSVDAARGRGGWFRPKNNLGSVGKLILLMMVCVPLLMMISRVIAYPDVALPSIPGIEWLRELGSTLNQYASLTWLPHQHRPVATYLLMLPTGALMIAMARLTLGLRVLGLRSILIAIGFQEIGVIPSLALMFVVIAVILAIRPAMTHIRLPLYARITLVLCVCAIFMVGMLMLGPVLKSQTVWSMAFFPVIITAMIAESVAKTIATENAITAAWRVFWTIALASVLAAVGQTGFMANLLLMFPEVMILQMVGIIVVAEYFDLRLFEEVPQKIGQVVEERDLARWSEDPVQKIAVVRDNPNPTVIGRIGESARGGGSRRAVQPVVDALRADGAAVKVFDGDISLLKQLQKFLPSDVRTGEPGGLVFNLARGVQGTGMAAQVPAMLEMAGVAYSGPNPVVHGQLSDRWLLLTRLQRAGVPVPRFCRVESLAESGLSFPLRIHPTYDLMMPTEVVKSEESLRQYLENGSSDLSDKIILEEIPGGREIRVGLIGNERVSCLPPLENIPRPPRRICPAELENEIGQRIHATAIEAFKAAGCRDYARVDFRVTLDGEVIVVAVHFHDVLAKNGSMAQAARAAGLDFTALINCIARVARARY
jgi:D-alanine-D-alanine ligase